MTEQADEPTFEQVQTELEQIVERLERGQAPLDEALALWERGEALYTFCREKLDTAQGRVEELARGVRRLDGARDAEAPASPAPEEQSVEESRPATTPDG